MTTPRPLRPDQAAAVLGMSPDAILTVPEVAEYLRMSEVWVRRHASGLRHPRIPCIRFGGAVRFRQSAIDAFVREQEQC